MLLQAKLGLHPAVALRTVELGKYFALKHLAISELGLV